MLVNPRDIRGKAGLELGQSPSPTNKQKDRAGLGASSDAPDLQAAGFFRDFMTGLTEPAMIPAFLAGGLTYRAIRSGVAGQWVASPAVKSISGLFGRQLAASSLALGGETVVFTGTHRAALGLTQNWRGTTPVDPGLGTELAATGVMLASLRSFGFGFGMMGTALQRAGIGGAGSALLLSQAGSYTGLLTAQQLEHRLLHPEIPETGNPYLNAAVSLIHFTGFGMMARNITPRGWQLLENKLEQKTERLFSEKLQQIRNDFTPQWDTQGLAWQAAGAADLSKISTVEDPKTRGLNFMWGRKRVPSDPPPDPMVFKDLLPKGIRDSVTQIDNIIDATEMPFLKTFAQAQINDQKTIDLAVGRLHNILYFSEIESAKSSYTHWIINQGLRRIVEKRDAKALDDLMIMITQPTSIQSLEGFLARQMGGTRLPEPFMGISSRFKKKSDYYETIEKMPLSQEAKNTLWLLLVAQKKGRDDSPHYINPHDFMNRLREVYQLYDAKWPLVQQILERAPTSALGLLRLKRLHLILRSELEIENPLDMAEPRGLLGIKLRELANDQYQTSGPLPNPLPKTDAEIYLGPDGGFMGEHGPWKLLKHLIPQIPDLVDPERAAQRTALRHTILKGFFAKHPGAAAYQAEGVAEAYRLLSHGFKGMNYEFTRGEDYGDFSHHMALAIQRGEFTLEVLDRKNYERRNHELRKRLAESAGKNYDPGPILANAYFINAEQGKVVNHGKPLIILARPELNKTTPEEIFDDYFKVLGIAIHEGKHYFEKLEHKQRNWNEGVEIKEEAATETTHLWWRAQHGDAEMLHLYLLDSPAGFTSRLMDWWESNYRARWAQNKR